jgi:hypothetical protein
MTSCCIQVARKIFFERENRGPKDGGCSLIQSCAAKVKTADTVDRGLLLTICMEPCPRKKIYCTCTRYLSRKPKLT